MKTFQQLGTENILETARDSILLLPIGALEQHGPHLPLTVDIEIPVQIGTRLAAQLPLIVAPVIAYGARSLPQSGGGSAYPGTVSIRGNTFTLYVRDVISGYAAAGFRFIFILNGHYENEAFIFEAIELCREEGHLERTSVVAAGWWSFVSGSAIEKLLGKGFPGWHAEHASACETSLMLYFNKELVGPERVDNAKPPQAGIYVFPRDAAEFSNRGVLGFSSPASAEIGRALSDQICSGIGDLLRQRFEP